MSARPVAVAVLALALGSAPGQAARVELVNVDGPNEGFNDPTPVAPVAGNPERTLGAQRLRVFEAVAWRLGAFVASEAVIRIKGGWDSLDCERTSGTLAQAGPTFVFRDFPGAPRGSTWYAAALANALAGEDLNPGKAVMEITFNADVGSGGCLFGREWDYRIGVGNSDGFSLEQVFVHEGFHGLGFISFVDSQTGEKFLDFDDAYSMNLEDHELGRKWNTMSDAERAASATREGLLHWLGGNALAHAPRMIGGAHLPSGHPRMYSPQQFSPGSSVSHWDTVLDHNVDDIMEPFARANVTDLLTGHLLQDLGWAVNRSGVDHVEDQDGNGAVEVVLLQVTEDPPGHEVVLLDSRGGKVVGRIPLPAGWAALDVAVVSHFAGPPASEIAVLQWRPQRQSVRVTLFDASSGEQVALFNYPRGFPMRLLSVGDFGATSADELALLGSGVNTGARVWVRDARSGKYHKVHRFPSTERPVDLAVLESFNGNNAPEFATLLAVPSEGRAQIKVRDGRSGELLATIEPPEGQVPQFIAPLADFGGAVGSGEVAFTSLGSEDGTPRLTVYDGKTGEQLASRDFDNSFVPVGLEVLPHFGDTRADEIVLWTRLPRDLKPKGFIVDGGSMSTLGSRSLGSRWAPRAIAVLPNVGRTGAADIAVVAGSSRERKLRAFLIDGRGAWIRNLTPP